MAAKAFPRTSLSDFGFTSTVRSPSEICSATRAICPSDPVISAKAAARTPTSSRRPLEIGLADKSPEAIFCAAAETSPSGIAIFRVRNTPAKLRSASAHRPPTTMVISVRCARSLSSTDRLTNNPVSSSRISPTRFRMESIASLPLSVRTSCAAAPNPFVLLRSMVSCSTANLLTTRGSMAASRRCWMGLSAVDSSRYFSF